MEALHPLKKYGLVVGDDRNIEVQVLGKDKTGRPVGRHIATIRDKAVSVPMKSGRSPLHVGVVGNLREAIELAAWIDEHCAV